MLAELTDDLATDKATVHAAYLPVYDHLFSPLRETALPILELGVWCGGSLRLWERFFPAAPIIGVDTNFHPRMQPLADRTKLVLEDAYTAKTVASLQTLGPYAVIIDDGPHTDASQLYFARHYPHLLAPDGIAIIEDVQSTTMATALWAATPEGFEAQVIDLRDVRGVYDDMLIVIRPRAKTL